MGIKVEKGVEKVRQTSGEGFETRREEGGDGDDSKWGYSHGEDGGDSVQRSDEDTDLTDPTSQQQGPGGLSISLAMTKHLGDRDSQRVCLFVRACVCVCIYSMCVSDL